MFNLTGLKGKLEWIVIIALIVVAAGGAFYVYNQGQQLEKTQEKVKAVQESAATLETGLEAGKKEFDDFKKSTDVNTGTNQAVVKETIIVETKSTEIEKRVSKQIAEINDKFKAMADTEENRLAKELEVSTERMKGLWASFCIAKPEHVNCK